MTLQEQYTEETGLDPIFPGAPAHLNIPRHTNAYVEWLSARVAANALDEANSFEKKYITFILSIGAAMATVFCYIYFIIERHFIWRWWPL